MIKCLVHGPIAVASVAWSQSGATRARTETITASMFRIIGHDEKGHYIRGCDQ
jgi:hypothetical protein